MDTIYIPHLAKILDQTETIAIQDYLPELETLTPIQGEMKVSHRGNYLEVTACAETIVTLTCDRCLQNYNHRLAIDTAEMIWLQEGGEDPDAYPLEREVTVDDLVEILPSDGYFDPAMWLYEQLCLNLPQRKLCDRNCQGIPLADQPPESHIQDRRWASLEAFKQNLLN
jgi:uncharacterized protein